MPCHAVNPAPFANILASNAAAYIKFCLRPCIPAKTT